MRYEFETVSKSGFRFLWTYPIDDLVTAQFAMRELKSHGEYGTVGELILNLVDDPVLGLIVVG